MLLALDSAVFEQTLELRRCFAWLPAHGRHIGTADARRETLPALADVVRQLSFMSPRARPRLTGGGDPVLGTGYVRLQGGPRPAPHPTGVFALIADASSVGWRRWSWCVVARETSRALGLRSSGNPSARCRVLTSLESEGNVKNAEPVRWLVLLLVAAAMGCADDEAASDRPQPEPDVTILSDGDTDDTGPSLPAHAEEVERHALDLAGLVDVRLMAVGAQQLSNQVAVIDLADGETVVYPPGSYGPAIDGIQAAAATDAGTVVLAQHGVITAFRDGEEQPRLVHEPALINEPGTAPSVSLVAALAGERVWVVQAGHGGRPGSAELLDLVAGTALVEVELPSETHPVAATPSGLVLNEDRRAVWHLTEDGQLAELALGEAIAVPGDWVAVLACEGSAQGCELTLHHLESGERREVSKPLNGEWSGVAGPSVPTSAPRWWRGAVRHGRLLLSLQTAAADDPETETRPGHLVIVDPAAPDDVEVVDELDGTQVAAWAHDGHRIVLMDTDWQTGRDLTVVDVRDGSTFTVLGAIPAGHFVVATS